MLTDQATYALDEKAAQAAQKRETYIRTRLRQIQIGRAHV